MDKYRILGGVLIYAGNEAEFVLARNLSDCRDNEPNLQRMFCTGNLLQQSGNPKRAPHQQQGHDPIHQLIVTSVKSFQHVSCKCPDQVSKGTKEHQINSEAKQHRNPCFIR